MSLQGSKALLQRLPQNWQTSFFPCLLLSQPFFVRKTPSLTASSSGSREVSTCVGGQEAPEAAATGQLTQAATESLLPRSETDVKAVGMLKAQPRAPFLGNVALSLLGLDEDSKRYRAVLQWETAVQDPQFQLWYKKLDLGGSGDPDSPDSLLASIPASAPARGRHRGKRRQQHSDPAGTTASREQQSQPTDSTAPSQSPIRHPSPSSHSMPEVLNGAPGACHARLLPQFAGAHQLPMLPLRCQGTQPAPHSISHAQPGWRILEEPMEDDGDEGAFTGTVLVAESLDDLQQAIATQWEDEEGVGDEDSDWDGPQDEALEEWYGPMQAVRKGKLFSTAPSRGCLVFGYWQKCPLG